MPFVWGISACQVQPDVKSVVKSTNARVIRHIHIHMCTSAHYHIHFYIQISLFLHSHSAHTLSHVHSFGPMHLHMHTHTHLLLYTHTSYCALGYSQKALVAVGMSPCPQVPRAGGGAWHQLSKMSIEHVGSP